MTEMAHCPTDRPRIEHVSTIRHLVIALGLVLAWGAGPAEAGAGEDGEPEAGPISPQRPGRDVEHVPHRLGMPVAAEELDSAVIGVDPNQPPPRLLREGHFVVGQAGYVVRPAEAGRWVFIPASDAEQDEGDALPAMILQPSRDLETIEDFAIEHLEADEHARFTLSGVVHVYRGVNYLLPTLAEPPRGRAPGDETEARIERGLSELEEDAEQALTGGGAGEDPLEALRDRRQPGPGGDGAQREQRGVEPSHDQAQATRGVAPDQEAGELVDEGTIITSRRGRLARSADGRHVLFTFDADDRASVERPMIVLRCSLLERMERIVHERGEGTPFVVTGQVYRYRGENYLLPVTMQVAVDMPNLAP